MGEKEVPLYDTWYDFKTDLQRRSGIVLLNALWFRIKPKSALPWCESQMKEALSNLSSRILKLRTCPRCSGTLVLDRDFLGTYKKCIQCSFEIEIVPPTNAKSKPELANRLHQDENRLVSGRVTR